MRVFFHQFYHLKHLSQWVMIITWLCSNKTIGPNHESTENMNLFRPDSHHLPCICDLLLQRVYRSLLLLSGWNFHWERKTRLTVFSITARASQMAGLSLRGCVAFKTKNLRRCVWQNLWWSRNSCFSMYKINKLMLYYIMKHSNMF